MLTEIFIKNEEWASNINRMHPGFLSGLIKGQHPDYLVIGCSDSRVPLNEIMGLRPGEMFVHRNIANLVLHSDMNCQSIIEYAVASLKVKHIIVCGHYECGGIKAAMDFPGHCLIDNWLASIRDLYQCHKAEIEAFSHEKEKENLLCEFNVGAQVFNVCQTKIVQSAWKSGQKLTVHGLIYDLESGLLKDLNLCISNLDEICHMHKLF